MKKEKTPSIEMQILDGIYKELEKIQRQIGDLTVTLYHNGHLTAEQALAVINARTPREEEPSNGGQIDGIRITN
jgi:hypothetical protein